MPASFSGKGKKRGAAGSRPSLSLSTPLPGKGLGDEGPPEGAGPVAIAPSRKSPDILLLPGRGNCPRPACSRMALTPVLAYILLWFPERTQTFIRDEVATLAEAGLPLRVYTLYGRQRGAPPAPPVPVTRLGVAAGATLLRHLAGLRREFGPEAPAFLRQVLCRRWRSLETAAEALWAALAGVYLAKRAPAEGAAHLHAPWADGPATAAWVASHFSGLPFSFAAHAHDIYPPDGALNDKLQAAAWVHTVSRANRDYLAGLCPPAAARILTIPVGVSLPDSTPMPPERPPGPVRLLSVGRLVDKKGYPVLLEACHLLKAQGLALHLTLAGDGPRRRALQRQARTLGLEVTFLGYVPPQEVLRLYPQADLFVLPCQVDSRGDRDATPSVLKEALVHGVPVVSTAVSGVPELVRPGETGWLVPPGDPAALAAAIREALADPPEARRRALAGRELVAREYNARHNYGRLAARFRATLAGLDPGKDPRRPQEGA